MTIEIKSFSTKSKENFNLAVQLRFLVFSDEQGVEKDIVYDGLDDEAVQYLILIDNEPAATARWRETEQGLKIERMAVKKEFRSLGIGYLLLKHILHELIPSKLEIYLHAQEQVVNFYEFANFVKTGDKFSEAKIIHHKMIYKR
ncbi:MAG: GNAT family N-acetyltransferase [Bacteroidota bacterium]|nr:GNAT family N-acetyltransferase [Bacteroidota bacterium]